MTLAEASAQWLEAMARDDSVSQECAESRALSLSMLVMYAGSELRLDEITPARLRDFLARWVIENATRVSPPASACELIDSLAAFIEWAACIGFTSASECLEVIAELRDRVPRAMLIGSRLSEHLSGGAFGFPEFLTSFEAGGHSRYDLDAPGESNCLEGYFRILRVEGKRVEAEELLTETRAWPILFPEDVVALLEADYLINLELVQREDHWQVVACGFAYPPGTEV
ncbi:MAG TPA: hypothetical protein VKA60_12955 [Blastocatellia bacterium]|nr:hypothetical protein [Blastocatellia bacterium]